MADENPLVDDTARRIVQLLANGQRPNEVCDELHMSRAALYRLMADVRARVGAKTNIHLVALALRRRWIS